MLLRDISQERTLSSLRNKEDFMCVYERAMLTARIAIKQQCTFSLS